MNVAGSKYLYLVLVGDILENACDEWVQLRVQAIALKGKIGVEKALVYSV